MKMKNNKYAYLIMAHKNPNQLQKLISSLDDYRNDIYLLIDKKSRNFPSKFKVSYSSIYYLKRINIYWGGYSQIQAELNLFSAASHNHYKYYHLLTGQDLPLVDQNVIHNFFDNHPNKEFISFFPLTSYRLSDINMRLKPHILKKHLLSNNCILQIVQRIYFKLLKFIPQLSINKKDLISSSSLITIDDKLIQFILSHENWIYRHFKQGILVDELFIPILIRHNKFFNKRLYKNNLRYIKFIGKSAHPHVWTIKDMHEINVAINEGYLFARKFDSTVDNKIINVIYNKINK